MSNDYYDLFLTGHLAQGYSRERALQHLAKLFKREPSQLEGLIRGRPNRIKKKLATEELAKFQAVFDRIGLITEAIPSQDENSPEKAAATSTHNPAESQSQNIAHYAAAAPAGTLALEPVGSPVLKENERRQKTEREVDTSGMSLAAFGSPIATTNQPPATPPLPLQKKFPTPYQNQFQRFQASVS